MISGESISRDLRAGLLSDIELNQEPGAVEPRHHDMRIPDKYHSVSVVNIAEIVMILLMILTPTFVLLQGGVSHCSTAACWDP